MNSRRDNAIRIRMIQTANFVRLELPWVAFCRNETQNSLHIAQYTTTKRQLISFQPLAAFTPCALVAGLL
jgi:hypothetical protein